MIKNAKSRFCMASLSLDPIATSKHLSQMVSEQCHKNPDMDATIICDYNRASRKMKAYG
jgi:hypothetical protein